MKEFVSLVLYNAWTYCRLRDFFFFDLSHGIVSLQPVERMPPESHFLLTQHYRRFHKGLEGINGTDGRINSWRNDFRELHSSNLASILMNLNVDCRSTRQVIQFLVFFSRRIMPSSNQVVQEPSELHNFCYYVTYCSLTGSANHLSSSEVEWLKKGTSALSWMMKQKRCTVKFDTMINRGDIPTLLGLSWRMIIGLFNDVPTTWKIVEIR